MDRWSPLYSEKLEDRRHLLEQRTAGRSFIRKTAVGHPSSRKNKSRSSYYLKKSRQVVVPVHGERADGRHSPWGRARAVVNVLK